MCLMHDGKQWILETLKEHTLLLDQQTCGKVIVLSPSCNSYNSSSQHCSICFQPGHVSCSRHLLYRVLWQSCMFCLASLYMFRIFFPRLCACHTHALCKVSATPLGYI